jgi:Mn2+/Fe2+ NRAMP family transporter
MNHKKTLSILLGAAFLMATSAIGPGFITQTAVFTEQYGANFAFVILVVIILDIGAQMNVWRVMTMANMRGQDIAEKLVPGLGIFLAVLVALGGFAFNIGNLAGCGLGFNVLFGISAKWGAAVSALIAVLLFLSKEIGRAMDTFTKALGCLMILLTTYVMVTAHPPYGEAVERCIMPADIPLLPIVTLLGGTVGGYITFAGGHRLIEAGITGLENLKKVTRSSVTGILITGVMRIVLFLAVLGIVAVGIKLDPANPPASAFKIALGGIGYKIFGIVFWSAAITSVVGAAYTSVSFLRSFHKTFERDNKYWIIAFILLSALTFTIIGRPVKMLILVGAFNGLILPVSLGIILWASRRKDIVGEYHHPAWLFIFGVIVVGVAGYAGYQSLQGMAGLFK